MKRRVFVGSSAESMDKAKHICDVLATVDDTEPVLWNELFEPGFLTFEALEHMLRCCCAAVFVATPDDDIIIRGKKGKCPRANVMLEFGLVAGRLGRHSIALCRYGGAELPSDLKGLTVIEMDRGEQQTGRSFYQAADKKLHDWGSRLIGTADTIARTDIVHGYAGEWKFHVWLKKLRGLVIVEPDYAEVTGYFDLIISADGQTGRGLARARFYLSIAQEHADAGQFTAEYRTAHLITGVVCCQDGSVEFNSRVFCNQEMNSSGTPSPQLTRIKELHEPGFLRWKLSPSATKPRTLEGTVTGITEGMAWATKG